MRIVCISDTHRRHRDIRHIPDGDVLVHAGDFSEAAWGFADYVEMNKWLGELPHKHKVIVAGNHDRYAETHGTWVRDTFTNAHYLQDAAVTLDGVKFYGTPWQPVFFDWAFNCEDEKQRGYFSQIHDDTQVLVTHCPPRGVLDLIAGDHVGSRELRDRVLQVQPLLHVFGHIHVCAGVQMHGNILSVNAAVLDNGYQPCRTPIMVEI